MIPVFVGSKNRLMFPVADIVKNLIVFVEPQDYDDYLKFHGSRHIIVKLSKDNGGFGFMLNSMLDYAKGKGIEYFAFSDDDISAFKVRPRGHANIDEMLTDCEKVVKEGGYSQLMVSFAGHNWYFKGEIKEKIGAWCFIVTKTSDLLDVGGYDEVLPIFNDWDMSAKLIKTGFKVACYYKYMFVHKMKSMEGVASEIYKKQELIDSAIILLQKKYGEDCIKIVEAHGQKEARFKWSKL